MAMQEYNKEMNKIRSILIGSTKGCTVTEISKRIGINRNSVAKYLDILVTTGTVEMKTVGSAKLFTLSKRMPLSSIIDISSDYILLLDEDSNVTYANENMLRFENSTLEEIIGKPVSTLELSRKSGSRINRIVLESISGREISTDLEFRKGADLLAFHAKFVPGLFENNKKGLIIVLSSIPNIARFSGDETSGIAASPASPFTTGIGNQSPNSDTGKSEKMFRDYVELAQEGIWAIDETGKTTFLNQRMAEMLGYGVEEMIGMPFFSFLDDSGKHLAQKMMDIQSRERTVYKSSSFEFIKKDGTVVSTMLASNPFFNESVGFAGGLAIITDITIRKKAEDALRQSEAYYRAIIETSPNGIVIFDPLWQNPDGKPADRTVSRIP